MSSGGSPPGSEAISPTSKAVTVFLSPLLATRLKVQVPLDTVVAPPRPLMILLACFVMAKPITSTASSEIMDGVSPQSYSTFSLKHCPSFSAATLPAPEGRFLPARSTGQGAYHHHLLVLQDVVQQVVLAPSTSPDVAVAYFSQRPAPLRIHTVIQFRLNQCLI